jgi:transposase
VYYSTDLRERAVKYAETHTAAETSEAFGVGVRTIFKWKKKLRETGNLERKPLNRKFRKLDPEKLKKWVEEHPDAYLWEIAEKFEASQSGVYYALQRIGITVKKKRNATGSGTRKGVRSLKGHYPATKRRT